MACHLLEHAVCAAPDATEVHEARAAIYAERAAGHEGSMARNLLLHAAASSRQGKRDLAGDW
jgi:alkyl sulfatase BDS1-like metallo-beta-lactamase superfamily hydrolase